MNQNSIQEAIDWVNKFEANLVQPNITQFKSFTSSIPASAIKETDDIIEFLQNRLKLSQSFTSSVIKSKIFTLEDDKIVLTVEFQPTFSSISRDSVRVYINNMSSLDDYLVVTEKN